MSGSDLSIFDVQFATNQFSGNQLLLVKILKKFIQQYLHFDALLAEHIEQEDLIAFKLQIHTIKGVCGNLGMNALHQASKELEIKLEDQFNKHTLDDFLKVFKQTLSLVQNYSAENGSEENSQFTPQQDHKKVLIAALKVHEFISEDKMQSYSQSLDLTSEKLIELKQAIENLDYAIAIKLLES